jgi:hypothetical protein
MELVVVSWGIRCTFLAAVAVVGVSTLAGAPIVDAVDRAVLAALVFTIATGWLLDRLEPPERRLQRLRAKRMAKREKGKKGKGAEQEDEALETTGSAPMARGIVRSEAGRADRKAA